MRARILWAAALASLLVGLALGLERVRRRGRTTGSGRPRTPTWSVVAPLPQTLSGRRGRLQRHLLATRRAASTDGTTLDTFYRYNPVNERWDTYPSAMPAAVSNASAVYYPTTNSIYVFGGQNGTVFSNATRVFDITMNTWSSVANMPAPRASMAAGYNSANGRIYLAGGG